MESKDERAGCLATVGFALMIIGVLICLTGVGAVAGGPIAIIGYFIRKLGYVVVLRSSDKNDHYD